MNRPAYAAMKRTGKPYGGHLDDCEFFEVFVEEGVEDIGPLINVARGFLRDDPRYRFSPSIFGFPPQVRTSYIIKRTQRYI